MNWLVKPLESFFQWTFGILKAGEGIPNTIFILLIIFGLAYWTFYWQPKYNKQAESDRDQIK